MAGAVAFAGCGRIGFGEDAGGNEGPLQPSTPYTRLFGSPAFDFPNGIAILGSGDVLVTGAMIGPLDFGLGPLEVGGTETAFFAALASDGSTRWAHSQISTDVFVAGAAATEPIGARVVGHFSGMASYQGLMISTPGPQYAIAFDVTNDGGFGQLYQWGSSTGGNAQSYTVARTADGRMAFGGAYGGSFAFAPTIVLPPSDLDDGFLALFDAGFVPRGADGLVATGARNYIQRVDFDGNGILCGVGSFENTATVAGTMLTSAGADDGLALLYDRAFTPIAQVVLSSANVDRLFDVAGLADGGFIIAGMSGPGDAVLGTTTVTTTSSDVIVARLSATGTVLWARALGGPADETRPAVAVRGAHVYLAFGFAQSVTLAGQTFPSTGLHDVAIAELDNATGQPISAWHIGGAADEGIVDMVVDARNGDVILLGQFEGVTDIAGVTGTFGSNDLFVHRFSPL